MSENSSKTSPLLVALAWTLVALPLGWGLYVSVIKSKPLFTGDSVTAAQPAPASSRGK